MWGFASNISSESASEMGLFDFPNPMGWIEGAKDAGFERETVNAILSAAFSAWIGGMWSLGQRKFFGFAADAATGAYLSLRELESKGLLTLTMPQAMLEAENLSRFQTEMKRK